MRAIILLLLVGCTAEPTPVSFDEIMRTKTCGFDPVRGGCWCIYRIRREVVGVTWAPFFECTEGPTAMVDQKDIMISHGDPTRDP